MTRTDEDFTLGVEEEFAIVDADTGELRPDARRLLDGARDVLGDEVQPELNLSQVETGTKVCASLADLRSELVRLRVALIEVAGAAGCRVLSSGSHPTASWKDSVVNPTKERYRFLDEEFGLTAREQLVNGCHVHVGIADPDLAIAVLDRTRPWIATLLALTANSPYWMGTDSRYASYRTQIWAQWPLTGMPEPLGSRAAYDRLVDDLERAGAMPDPTFLYWDVRPSVRYPTLEFRIADACLSVDDSILFAGLVRALARTAAAEAGRGEPPPAVRPELVRTAKWRAARYGLEGTLLDLTAGTAVPAASAVRRLLDHVDDALDQAGDRAEVRALVERTLSEGNGAMRQRAAFAATRDLAAVVETLARETDPFHPNTGSRRLAAG
ncbi:MAG TPA: glutamate--cysteine ligase [Acidimicrobiales bacterium]